MQFSDWLVLAAATLGGGLLLIGLIAAGSMAVSFATGAQPIPETAEGGPEAPEAAISI